MNDEYTFYTANPDLFQTHGSVSYSSRNGIPYATLSAGSSMLFTFDGQSCVIHFLRYQRTGNVMIYVDGVLFDTLTVGLNANYQVVSFLVNNQSDSRHELLIVPEGNQVIPVGSSYSSTSNILVQDIKGVSYDYNQRELYDFANFVVPVILFCILVVKLFSLFGIFGGNRT